MTDDIGRPFTATYDAEPAARTYGYDAASQALNADASVRMDSLATGK